MVMGKVTTHYVEITPTKKGFKCSCVCGWAVDDKERINAKSRSHLHLAGYVVTP
jgi:hypothetical protein